MSRGDDKDANGAEEELGVQICSAFLELEGVILASRYSVGLQEKLLISAL